MRITVALLTLFYGFFTKYLLLTFIFIPHEILDDREIFSQFTLKFII